MITNSKRIKALITAMFKVVSDAPVFFRTQNSPIICPISSPVLTHQIYMVAFGFYFRRDSSAM